MLSIVRVLFVIYLAAHYFSAGYVAFSFIPNHHNSLISDNAVAFLYVQVGIIMFLAVFLLGELAAVFINSYWFVRNKSAVYGVNICLFMLNNIYVLVFDMYHPTFDEYVNSVMQAILVGISIIGMAHKKIGTDS